MPSCRPPRPPLAALGALLVLALAASGCRDPGAEPRRAAELPALAETSLVLDAGGGVLARLHGAEDREVVPLRRMPPVLLDAVLAMEDARFYDHEGVDARAAARAALANVRARRIRQGGSTITQQLAKHLLVGEAPRLERKVAEARLALALERRYGKDEILARYLNTIPFGNGAAGVAAAARRYFGAEVEALTLPQAALLTAILNAPSRYDPYRHPERALARRNLVLDRMADLQAATPEEIAAARAAPLGLAEGGAGSRLAPAFVDHVLRSLRHDAAFGVLGADPAARTERLRHGGLRIETTLDPEWQHAAEEAVAATLPSPEDPEAALVALAPADGEIRALVGGRTTASAAPFNLATDGRRQPGSTFKPLVLAAALARGHTLDEEYPPGSSVEVPGRDGQTWRVGNHDGRDPGPASLAEATAQSVNTVYARLITAIGPEAVIDVARAAGVTRDLAPLPSLALGAQEVSPLEMASVAATFAAGGVHHPPSAVRRILGPDGEVLYERPPPTPRRAMDPGTAWLTTAALRRVVTEGTGDRADLRRPVAGKTGTTSDGADAWFVGYTPDVATAVWIGFPAGRVPMEPPRTRVRVEGGTWPAEVFGRFGLRALADVPANDFPPPEGPCAAGETCPGTVPDLLGLPLAEAARACERAGLVAQPQVACPDGSAGCLGTADRAGQVWEQVPDPSAPSTPGQAVTLRVYPG